MRFRAKRHKKIVVIAGMFISWPTFFFFFFSRAELKTGRNEFTRLPRVRAGEFISTGFHPGPRKKKKKKKV